MAFLHSAASHVKLNGLKKGRLPYLLLAPGMLFLFTFFILPIGNLASTSTQTPVSGGDTGVYEQTWSFSNYITAFVENKDKRDNRNENNFGSSGNNSSLTTELRDGNPYGMNSGGYALLSIIMHFTQYGRQDRLSEEFWTLISRTPFFNTLLGGFSGGDLFLVSKAIREERLPTQHLVLLQKKDFFNNWLSDVISSLK